MSANSFSLKFKLVKNKITPEGYPIYLRIIVNRKKSEIAINEYIAEEKWDKAAGMPKKKPSLESYLTFIKGKVHDIRRELEMEGQTVTARVIKEIHKQVNSKDELRLYDYFCRHISEMESLNGQFSIATIKGYNTSKNHIKAFLKFKNLDDIVLKDFDVKLITELDHFLLINKHPITGTYQKRNAVNKHHSRIKTIILKANRLGLLEKNPYVHFPLKYEKTHRTYLIDDELGAIKNCDLTGNESLDRVRDIFLFSCYTGLRYQDAIQLKDGQVKPDSEGNYWISVKQSKTNEPIRVPLIGDAQKIYEKYEVTRKITGRILPKISNQKLNVYLKTIGNLAGIDKQITHHMARHTFATTITLSKNVPIEVVSKLLGHTSLETTQIYAKITSDYLLETKKALDEKLK